MIEVYLYESLCDQEKSPVHDRMPTAGNVSSTWSCVPVNCAIMQKSGAGLHTANSCYWDTATDGERDETPMHTVLTFEQPFAFVVLMNSVLRFGLFRRVQQSMVRPIWTFLALYRYRR
jgi:hypothetical protein